MTRLKNEIKTGSPGWWNIVEAAGGWDNVVLVNAQNKENARFRRQEPDRRSQRNWNKDPADAAFDLVMQGKGRVYAIYHMMSEQDIITALKFPWTSIGSDAGASEKTGTGRCDRPCTSASLRKSRTPDRTLRSRAEGALARRSHTQNDLVAGDAYAARFTRNDKRRQLGRCRHF